LLKLIVVILDCFNNAKSYHRCRKLLIFIAVYYEYSFQFIDIVTEGVTFYIQHDDKTTRFSLEIRDTLHLALMA